MTRPRGVAVVTETAVSEPQPTVAHAEAWARAHAADGCFVLVVAPPSATAVAAARRQLAVVRRAVHQAVMLAWAEAVQDDGLAVALH